MPTERTNRTLLAAILLIYLLLAGAYALRVPAWLSPDEPAHYNYIAQLADSGCCPVIEPGDWDQVYLSQLTGSDFAADQLDRFDSIQYEDHQPPLYYLLASPIFALTGGSLTALRLFSALIGAGVVAAAYAVGRTLLPDRPQIALGMAALVAFVPQHLHILASVNNDCLAELIVGGSLYALLRYLRDGGIRLVWILGVLAGVGMLTKANTIFLSGLIPLAILLKAVIDREQIRTVVMRLALFALPALMLAGVWWVRNFTFYGFPDFLGLRAHDMVVVGQPRTADLIARAGMGEYLRQLGQTTFYSFWGQFGWMELAMPTWVYLLIGAFLGIALVGGVVGMLRPRETRAATPMQRLAWALMGVTLVLALAQFAYYNTSFQQFQGRYIFPGLIPFAAFVVCGIDALWWLVTRRVTAKYPLVRFGTVVIVSWLVPLNLFLLWRVIPGLT